MNAAYGQRARLPMRLHGIARDNEDEGVLCAIEMGGAAAPWIETNMHHEPGWRGSVVAGVWAVAVGGGDHAASWHSTRRQRQGSVVCSRGGRQQLSAQGWMA